MKTLPINTYLSKHYSFMGKKTFSNRTLQTQFVSEKPNNFKVLQKVATRKKEGTLKVV